MGLLQSESLSASGRAHAEVSSHLKILTMAPRIDLDPDGPTVSVVIPTRNEQPNLTWLARHMPANVFEIIVVDGGSTDGTVPTARGLWPDARVVHQTRRGKGNALACGFHASRAEIVVMIDADGSMDPGEIPYFVRELRAGADYVKGSRFTTGGGSSDITALRAWGNRRLNRATRAVHGTRYSDLCYGYNAFWRRILPHLDLDPGRPGEFTDQRRWGDGFEVETLINIRVHAAGLKIAEVASYESERLFGTSNLNTFRDGARVLRTIALEKRVRNRRAARSGGTVPTKRSLTASPVFPDPTSDDPVIPLAPHTAGADGAWLRVDLQTIAVDRARLVGGVATDDLISAEIAEAERVLDAMTTPGAL